LTDTQERRIASNINEIDPNGQLAEYIRNCGSGSAGRQTILIHNPNVEVSRVDLLPNLAISNMLSQAHVQQTQPITLEVSLPDYANNLITKVSYTDVSIGISTTGSISVTAGDNLTLELDDDGDGTTDRAIDPTLEEIVQDYTAPAAVSNLSITEVVTGSVSLSWSATGDDGLTGRAASYDLRYSPEPLTPFNWGSATQVISPTTPAPTGATQTMTANDLPSGQHYFAIRAVDEENNVGPVSNSPGATVIGYPLGDFDHSCSVDAADFQHMSSYWRTCVGEARYDATVDLNLDACVNVVDFALESTYWGDICE